MNNVKSVNKKSLCWYISEMDSVLSLSDNAKFQLPCYVISIKRGIFIGVMQHFYF